MERGLKLFLPGPTANELQAFMAVLRLARQLGYDFVMLELGGAMEYRRHPEINAAWVKYAAFMNEFPGKAQLIQNSQRWAKNSIHTDNGHGLFLTQEHLRQIVVFCAECGLEIVPEVPTLSHSDYLLLAHPELAERPEDPYPDSACPLHPDYFPLVEDILDEVIALFAPRRINIGHDEAYTLGKCPRCKGHETTQLYADEINRLAGWLRGRGVKTMMWAEKLLDAHFMNGDAIGGAAIPATAKYEGREALYPCGELLDKEIQMLHWYWGIDRRFEKRYEELGLDYWFGNFDGPQRMPEMARRLAAPRCRGFVVSNWGAPELISMQRNGVLYSLFYAALATDGRHDPDDYDTLDKEVRQALFDFCRPQGECLEVVHTTHTSQKFHYFYDGCYLDERSYRMGDHVFEDEEGRPYRLPVVFGRHLSNDDCLFGRRPDTTGHYDNYKVDEQLIEATGTSLPFQGEDGRVFYRTRYPHPAPGHKLRHVRFEPASVFVPAVEAVGVSETAAGVTMDAIFTP